MAKVFTCVFTASLLTSAATKQLSDAHTNTQPCGHTTCGSQTSEDERCRPLASGGLAGTATQTSTWQPPTHEPRWSSICPTATACASQDLDDIFIRCGCLSDSDYLISVSSPGNKANRWHMLQTITDNIPDLFFTFVAGWQNTQLCTLSVFSPLGHCWSGKVFFQR